MARHLAFAGGFAVTCALVLPIAWRPLDASIEKDGRRLRPLQQELQIGSTRVTLDLDRSLVMTGDSVVATLRAYDDTRKQVGVDVALYYSNDEWGGRVSSPPKAIDLEHLTLAAAPDGGKPLQTRLKLDGTGKLNTYKIFAAPRGHDIDVSSDSDGQTAAVSAVSWSGNDFDIAIRPQGKIIAGKPFTVAVRIVNTSGHKVKHVPYIHLGTQVGLSGVGDRDDYKIEEVETTGDDDSYERKFRPGDVAVRKFTVTPTGDPEKQVTFVASAYAWVEEPGPIAWGAMDAETFRIAPEKQAAKARVAAR
jgi:hypothetical protein